MRESFAGITFKDVVNMKQTELKEYNFILVK